MMKHLNHYCVFASTDFMTSFQVVSYTLVTYLYLQYLCMRAPLDLHRTHTHTHTHMLVHPYVCTYTCTCTNIHLHKLHVRICSSCSLGGG